MLISKQLKYHVKFAQRGNSKIYVMRFPENVESISLDANWPIQLKRVMWYKYSNSGYGRISKENATTNSYIFQTNIVSDVLIKYQVNVIFEIFLFIFVNLLQNLTQLTVERET